jgi:hypothetical protein
MLFHHRLPEWVLRSRQEPARQRSQVYCNGRSLLRVGVQVDRLQYKVGTLRSLNISIIQA